MPRLADFRLPAEPSSALQRAKYERMLQAATELGAVYDFDHVQMHEVARRAGVAIATLYRYFPSKTHLFVNVMLSEIAKMSHNLERRNGRLAELGPIESASRRADPRVARAAPPSAGGVVNDLRSQRCARVAVARRAAGRQQLRGGTARVHACT